MFFAAKLVRICKERKLSQKAVARRGGLVAATVSDLEERKGSHPRMSTVRELAMASGCSVEAFFPEDPEIGRGGGHK